jgi:hypothetical protein
LIWIIQDRISAFGIAKLTQQSAYRQAGHFAAPEHARCGARAGHLEALYSVTRDAARIAFVDKDLGTVEAGKLGDLILVRGDPLTDLRAAADVRVVLKNGRVFTRDEILAPARTPAQLALQARERLCREAPQHCAEEGGHAH